MEPIPIKEQLVNPCKRFNGHHRKVDGRPIVSINGDKQYAYIVEWEKANNKRLTPGCILHHVCDNSWCIESTHLVELTQSQHMKVHGTFARLNKQKAKERTHCPNGHEYNEENTRWVNSKRDGKYRACRKCSAIAKEEYRTRQRLLGLPY